MAGMKLSVCGALRRSAARLPGTRGGPELGQNFQTADQCRERHSVEPCPGLIHALSQHPVVGENASQLKEITAVKAEGHRRQVIEMLLANPEMGAEDARIQAGVGNAAGPKPLPQQKFVNAVVSNIGRLTAPQQKRYLPEIAGSFRSEDVKRQLRDMLTEQLGEQPAASGDANDKAALNLAFGVLATASATVDSAGLTGGYDEETDDDLSARFLAEVRKKGLGGNSADYQEWATDLSEVTRAWTIKSWMGAGTVGVPFVMDGRANILPTTADVAAMQTALDALAPVPATPVAFSPTPVSVDFTLSVTPLSARAAVLDALTDLFATEATPSGTMLISRMRGAIADAGGVTDYDLRSPFTNFVPSPGSMPVLGNVSWF